jgi:hypothetical protein
MDVVYQEVSRTKSHVSHSNFATWFQKPDVYDFIRWWLETSDHKVNGPWPIDIVEGEWYCNSPEKRVAILNIKGRKIIISFYSRTTNPELVVGDKDYSLFIAEVRR